MRMVFDCPTVAGGFRFFGVFGGFLLFIGGVEFSVVQRCGHIFTFGDCCYESFWALTFSHPPSCILFFSRPRIGALFLPLRAEFNLSISTVLGESRFLASNLGPRRRPTFYLSSAFIQLCGWMEAGNYPPLRRSPSCRSPISVLADARPL